jgi:MFS family permease
MVLVSVLTFGGAPQLIYIVISLIHYPDNAPPMTSQRALGIELAPGVRPLHLWCYLLVALISSAYAGALSILQPGLLHALGIPPAEQATLTGNLAALQELVFILLLGPIGALADRLGRRAVYTAGLLLTGAGYALYAQAASVPGLVLVRLLVAVGSAAVVGMMVTVIADYPRESHRGKANGLQGLVATLGAFIPPMLLPLPALFAGRGFDELAAQQATFAVAGALGVFAAVDCPDRPAGSPPRHGCRCWPCCARGCAARVTRASRWPAPPPSPPAACSP